MAIRKPHIKQKGLYFITFTNTNWLPLIALSNAYDLVYSWFDYLKRDNHLVISYVIMPNHIHLVLAYNGGDKSLNTLVGNGKRFMTYEIVKRLKAQRELALLQKLKDVLYHTEIKGKKRHTVFKTSFDVVHCYSRSFIQQKVDYIHANPCSKKWMLAEHSSMYVHSSAQYYETGIQGIYPVSTWMELESSDRWDQKL